MGHDFASGTHTMAPPLNHSRGTAQGWRAVVTSCQQVAVKCVKTGSSACSLQKVPYGLETAVIPTTAGAAPQYPLSASHMEPTEACKGALWGTSWEIKLPQI